MGLREVWAPRLPGDAAGPAGAVDIPPENTRKANLSVPLPTAPPYPSCGPSQKQDGGDGTTQFRARGGSAASAG